MAKKHNNEQEVRGNARESALAFQRNMIRCGESLWHVERAIELYDDDNVIIESIRFKVPANADGSWLVVVKGWVGDQAVIAFHDGTPFAEALVGLVNRMRNKSLKWKEDEYANKGKDAG